MDIQICPGAFISMYGDKTDPDEMKQVRIFNKFTRQANCILVRRWAGISTFSTEYQFRSDLPLPTILFKTCPRRRTNRDSARVEVSEGNPGVACNSLALIPSNRSSGKCRSWEPCRFSRGLVLAPFQSLARPIIPTDMMAEPQVCTFRVNAGIPGVEVAHRNPCSLGDPNALITRVNRVECVAVAYHAALIGNRSFDAIARRTHGGSSSGGRRNGVSDSHTDIIPKPQACTSRSDSGIPGVEVT